MAYKVTRTHVRPNTEVEWYIGSPIVTEAYLNWLDQNWFNNGKIVLTTEYSADSLTLTVILTAQEESDWHMFAAQQEHIDFQLVKEAYNTEHGITQTTTFATV
jgi:hypothetical protein